MEAKTGIRPHLILLGLFALTGALLAFTVDVRITDQAGVRTRLPDTLGDDWVGHEVLFCQDPACGRSWLARELEEKEEGARLCPRNWQGEPCGGALATMSRGERLILPEDTEIFKKQYFHQTRSDETVFASVVLSGKDRSSIHRPETCMQGQGNDIDSIEVIDVPLEGRPPLRVMVLNLKKQIGPNTMRYTYYAYWFVGKDRETPYHWERLLWMAFDRVFRNVAHRWAYLAVSGERPDDLENTAHHQQIREVVGKLYPKMVLGEPSS